MQATIIISISAIVVVYLLYRHISSLRLELAASKASEATKAQEALTQEEEKKYDNAQEAYSVLRERDARLLNTIGLSTDAGPSQPKP